MAEVPVPEIVGVNISLTGQVVLVKRFFLSPDLPQRD